MKVCDLALFSQSSSSGVKTYIASKVEYVRQRANIDHVVIVPGPADHVSTSGRSKVIVVRGVPTPYPGIRIGVNLTRIAHLIAREEPDIIELNCQYTLGWAAFLATRHRRTPIVGVYHTDVAACSRRWAQPAGPRIAGAVERLVEFYEGLIYRHCTLTILLNTTMHARVARLGVERTRCLPCGVDVDTFRPERRSPEFRLRLGVRPEQKLIFYAGRFSPEKELGVLFEAFERLPCGEYVLMLAGDGPDTPAVARYVRTHRWVRHLGHIDAREELATAYASSDVFVTPGRYETFGMSTLEAICSGVPVVGIQGSGTAMLVTPATGVTTPEGDADRMADAIVELARRDPEPTRQACRRFAATHYSWDRVLDQYFETYRELIAGAPAPQALSA
jgi:alpha-1,6-mannosyltransferase